MMKSIGKPCAEKPHARFDEGRVDKPTCLLYPMVVQLFSNIIEMEKHGRRRAQYEDGFC